ncbi:MAG: VOC family protein [Streptococcaceae bacterium]|jgi:predicted enzyme related to lactoylglutathione lyase|nr:VOC family protein [Streptococcaceae bacterium]
MTAAPHAKGLPGWVEVSAANTDAVLKFYTDLFGWSAQDIGNDKMAYFILMNGDKTIGGLSGKMNEFQPSQWLTYFETDDIERSIKEVNENGGMTYTPALSIPGGLIAIASDPAGAPLGLVQSEQMNDSYAEENGLLWFELEVSKDLDKTLDFYRQVFNWTTKPVIENEEMTYLTVDQVIGVFSGKDFPDYLGNQSQWSVTFAVEDVEAMAKKAEALGGKVESIMKGTAYGDLAMLRDPEGAFFVVMHGVM